MKYNSKNILLSTVVIFSVAFIGYSVQKKGEDTSILINDLKTKNNQLETNIVLINKKLSTLAVYDEKNKSNESVVTRNNDPQDNVPTQWQDALNTLNEKQQLVEDEVQRLIEENKKLTLALQAVENTATMNANTSSTETVSNEAEVTLQANEAEETNTIEQLDHDFQQQDADSTWSAATLQSLEQAITSNADKVQLTQSVCRSSMCRLDIAFYDPESQEDDFRTVMDGITGTGESFFEIKADGNAIVYLAREGHDLF